MKRSVTDTELVETKTPPWNRETLASVDRRTLAAEIERLEAELAKSDEAARAAMYAVDERAFLAECAETSVKRAEAAEARVRELEAQYACKRHNGEEAPEAAAQLTDDMLRSCQICGLTVDISKGHCEPTIEFTMQWRTDKKTKKLAELEAQNARLREALEGLQSDAQCTLDLYNKNGPTWTSRDSGEEYYSASYVIDSTEERIATIKAALTDTKGTP